MVLALCSALWWLHWVVLSRNNDHTCGVHLHVPQPPPFMHASYVGSARLVGEAIVKSMRLILDVTWLTASLHVDLYLAVVLRCRRLPGAVPSISASLQVLVELNASAMCSKVRACCGAFPCGWLLSSILSRLLFVLQCFL